jgi:ferric-dicitrate binding protein FerR (iron transport regulator)
MDEQEKKKLIEDWYAAFDLPDKDLKVFTDAEHEEKVRLRLLNRIISQIPETKTESTLFFQKGNWMRIAAVLAFFFCSIPLYQYMRDRSQQSAENAVQWSMSKTQVGKMLKVILADGSEIMLNSGSRIRYPRQFTGAKREIDLDGEAFFKVKHNAKQPFLVNTGTVTTMVLGTSFNIRAYSGMERIAITVATGKVGVMASGKTLALLLPNQQISVHKANGRFELTEVPSQTASQWRQGLIRLDGASFSELALVIKNTWGLTLETKSDRLAAANFKTTFYTHNQITEVMKAISKITDAQYRIRDHIITLYE